MLKFVFFIPLFVSVIFFTIYSKEYGIVVNVKFLTSDIIEAGRKSPSQTIVSLSSLIKNYSSRVTFSVRLTV